MGDIEDDGNMDPEFSVFTFFAKLVLKHNVPISFKKCKLISNLAKVKNFLWFWNVFKGNSLNSRFRKHYLGVMEPPQIKNERYFSHVFQLFVGAKPNSCFLGRKNVVVRKRFTRKLTFPWKVCLFVEKGCLFEWFGGQSTLFSETNLEKNVAFRGNTGSNWCFFTTLQNVL